MASPGGRRPPRAVPASPPPPPGRPGCSVRRSGSALGPLHLPPPACLPASASPLPPPALPAQRAASLAFPPALQATPERPGAAARPVHLPLPRPPLALGRRHLQPGREHLEKSIGSGRRGRPEAGAHARSAPHPGNTSFARRPCLRHSAPEAAGAMRDFPPSAAAPGSPGGRRRGGQTGRLPDRSSSSPVPERQRSAAAPRPSRRAGNLAGRGAEGQLPSGGKRGGGTRLLRERLVARRWLRGAEGTSRDS